MPTKKPAAAKPAKASAAFTDEEKAAMKEYAAERKAAARRGPSASKADGEADLLAKITAMAQPDRSMAQSLHALMQAIAPQLAPRTWYGMPAYANDEGQVVCFFQSSQKFKTRYCTLGFSDKAHLDEGSLWPTAFALTEWTPAAETRIKALVKKAAG